MSKLYAERDIMQLDEDGNYYFDHAMAMTVERLHYKSDIAAELGYRDFKLSATKKELADLKASLPQIKHDAIIGLVDYAKREDILFLSDSDVTQYAKSLPTQAKEQS